MRFTHCYCLLPIRPDGSCRNGCDPAMRPSLLRAARARVRRDREAHRVDFERITLTAQQLADVSERIATWDPVAAYNRAQSRTRKRSGVKP